MAEENVMAEVMNLLEVEPAAALPAPGPDIPALREKLAILVSTGKCKEAIGTDLTHEQVRRLGDKDVMKYSKKYEAFVGAKTNEAMINSFLSLTVKTIGAVVKIKDPGALQNELKNDYVITKELSAFSGAIALGCGRLLAFANAIVITLKHIDFSGNPYLYAGQDEVDMLAHDEHMQAHDEHMLAHDEHMPCT